MVSRYHVSDFWELMSVDTTERVEDKRVSRLLYESERRESAAEDSSESKDDTSVGLPPMWVFKTYLMCPRRIDFWLPPTLLIGVISSSH